MRDILNKIAALLALSNIRQGRLDRVTTVIPYYLGPKYFTSQIEIPGNPQRKSLIISAENISASVVVSIGGFSSPVLISQLLTYGPLIISYDLIGTAVFSALTVSTAGLEDISILDVQYVY